MTKDQKVPIFRGVRQESLLSVCCTTLMEETIKRNRRTREWSTKNYGICQ
jgi:hypothetical protein